MPKLVFTYQHETENHDNQDHEDVPDAINSDSSHGYKQYPSLSVEKILDNSDNVSVR